MMSLGDTISCHLGRLHLGMLDVGRAGPRILWGVWSAGWFLVRRTSVDWAEVRGENPFPGLSPGSGRRGPWFWWAQVDFHVHDPSDRGDEGE